MSHWLYEGKNFDTIPNGHFGFIYLITNTQSGRKYIGRKYFYSTRRIKVKGRKLRKVVRKESDWKSYIGSNKTLKNDVNRLGKKNFKFEILILGETKGQVNYLEENLHHRFHVSIKEDYYNDCIGPRRFARVKFSNTVESQINEIKF